MENLEYLPIELVHEVLHLLRRKDQSVLSCVSKRHRALVEPTLYRDIRWEPVDVGNQSPPVDFLLRTIVSRPELASYIRFLSICCRKPDFDSVLAEFPGNGKHRSRPDFVAGESERIRSMITSLNCNAENAWMTYVNKGEVDVFIALLVSQSTNLRRLRLTYEEGTCFLGAVLEKAVAENSLRALEHVEYGSCAQVVKDIIQDEIFDYSQVKPLFSLPSIETLSMSLPSQGLFWPGPQVPMSGLKSLVLHHSEISEEHLGSLLFATPCLQSLEYNAWINVDHILLPPNEPWGYFSCAQLSHSLAQVQKSLRHLCISITFFSTGGAAMDSKNKFRGIAGKLETLRDFHQLSKLRMPTSLLSGWTPELAPNFEKLEDIPARLADSLPTCSLLDVHLSDDIRFVRREDTDRLILSILALEPDDYYGFL